MSHVHFVKIIKGSSSSDLCQAIGVDGLPISHPIPFNTPQGAFYQIDINRLANEQKTELIRSFSKARKMHFKDVEKNILEQGLFVPSTDCFFQNVTQYQIDLMRDIFRKNVTESYDGTIRKDVVAETFWLSIMIITFFLGDEWRVKNITENLFTNEERISYLRPNLTSENDRYEHQFRLTLFADCLFALQYCDGFDLKIEELRQLSPINKKVKLEDKAIEFLIASMVVRSGHPIKFRPRTGVERQDFDLEIILDHERKIYAEIKCKRDETPVNVNNLRRTLYAAGKQLPLNGPSVIFYRIPENWSNYSNLAKEMNKVVRNFFHNIAHVNAVVLVWEEWIAAFDSSKVSTIKYKTYQHPSPEFSFGRIKELLTPVNVPPNTKSGFMDLSFGKFGGN